MKTSACRLVLLVLSVILPVQVLSGGVDSAFAQIPSHVETPYTLIDAETRTLIEGGAEAPLRGNGPLTGYATPSSRGRTSCPKSCTCAWSSPRRISRGS